MTPLRKCEGAALRLASALLLTLGACSPLGPRPDTSRTFVLNSLARVSASGLQGATLGVGPVRLPGYLDRSQMVTRIGVNELDISHENWWGESLEKQVAESLSGNLTALLGPDRTVQYPWVLSDPPDFTVEVTFLSFEANSRGYVVADAWWRVRAWADPDRQIVMESAQQEPLETLDGASVAEALSRALEALSREIAASVRKLAG